MIIVISEAKLLEFYKYIKNIIENSDYKHEAKWLQYIQPIDKMENWYFLQEYSWVVIMTGLNYKVAQKLYSKFYNGGVLDFNAIKHQKKREALEYVYNNLQEIFSKFKKEEDKLTFLESLPFIGKITKYHIARNLGLAYAKPDRHLIRIADVFGYDDVQTLCAEISRNSGDKIGIVDLILWRFATITPNYIWICKFISHSNRFLYSIL